MKLIEDVFNKMSEMDNEYDSLSKKIKKVRREARKRMSQKREAFEEKRKERDKHFQFLRRKPNR